MEYLVLGFFTGLSLILAIGAQNIFVIEQGLKKQHIFLVCFVCSISDLILIFLGIFLFHYFIQYFNSTIELGFLIIAASNSLSFLSFCWTYVSFWNDFFSNFFLLPEFFSNFSLFFLKVFLIDDSSKNCFALVFSSSLTLFFLLNWKVVF